MATTAAMLGFRHSPAVTFSVIARSRPNCPRMNEPGRYTVPCTASATARVTGLQLSMTEITATMLRMPTALPRR